MRTSTDRFRAARALSRSSGAPAYGGAGDPETLSACLRSALCASGRLSPKRRRATGAFSVVEVLLSVTILAVLVSSMAVAFQASLRNCEENDQIASATQTGRSILNRVTTQIRGAQAIDLDVSYGELVILMPTVGSDQRQVRYSFDADNQVLNYEERINGVLTEQQVLLGNGQDVQVVNFHATIQIGKDWQGVTCAKSVMAFLTFQQDGRQTSVSASASPRRNQIY